MKPITLAYLLAPIGAIASPCRHRPASSSAVEVTSATTASTESSRASTDIDEATLEEGVNPKTKARFTLETVVESEGANLSVGERSLLSLARALVKDSRVIVLDEATYVVTGIP